MKIEIYDETGLLVTTGTGGGAGTDLSGLADGLVLMTGGVPGIATPGTDYLTLATLPQSMDIIDVIEVGSGGLAQYEIELSVVYIELELSILARTLYNSTVDDLLIQFNDDTVANEYVTVSEIADPDSHLRNDAPGDNSGIVLFGAAAGDTAQQNRFVQSHVRISSPVNAFAYRVLHFRSVYNLSASFDDTNMGVSSGGGFWLNSEGVVKIVVVPYSAEDFAEGTLFILKGIRA